MCLAFDKPWNDKDRILVLVKYSITWTFKKLERGYEYMLGGQKRPCCECVYGSGRGWKFKDGLPLDDDLRAQCLVWKNNDRVLNTFRDDNI